MKKKRERPIAMLLAMMMLVMNLIVSPVWAAPGDVAINETNFPDETFREYVKTKFDTDKNGILSQEELNEVTGIEVRDKGITTLQGIEYFTGLMGLDCSKNKLTALNLSKNTKLSFIYCEKNQLESLDLSHNKDLGVIICRQNKLKTLDLTYNTELRRLLCSINQLTNLDLSTNSKLTEIDCASNKLKTLELTNKTNLEELYCDQNQLTTLELTNDTKLKILSCRYNQLTTLDLTNKTNLEKLYCDSNQLTTLDLTNKTNLETLHCRDNQLATLDLSTNPKLKEINCEKNKLSELDLSHNTNLETLDCSDNQLKTLNLDTNTKLSHLYCHSNQLAALDLNDNIDSISFYGPYQKIYVSLPVDSTSLDLATLADNFDSEKVSDLKGQTITGTTLSLDGQPKEVFYKYKVSTNRELWVTLKIIYGEAFKVTFDRNKGLGYMDPLSLKAGSSYELPTCYFTPPEGKVFDKWEVNGTKYDAGDSITVNGDMTIKAIWKVFEEIAILEINEDTFPDANFRKYVSEKIDTSGNGTLSQEELDAVTAINVENKEITDLKGVEHFTELTKLNCNNNKLTTLNLTNNTKLENLSCLHNKLKSLDLSQNTNLKSLDCKQNQLTALNLTNNTKLIRLYCSYNDLTTLDLSKNKNLGTLYCNHNKLTNLDLSQNTNLTWINCQDNQLTNLDLSNNSKVKRFDGSGQVYDIKVSGSTLKFDLKSLPGKFDSSMASDWVGGKVDTVDSNILNLNNDPKPTEVKYNYKVNNGDKNIDVTLKVKYGNFVTITFNANGHGTAPADIIVNKGTIATAPTDPTDTENDFGGWYKEAGCTNKFDFTKPVNESITLYAKWTAKVVIPPPTETVTITFNANGHGTPTNPITVNKGEIATAPADPTDTENDFGGWYKEAGCTNKFDFTKPVNESITLYAKWTAKVVIPPPTETVTITFNANGHGTAPEPITVNKGEIATAPTDPTDTENDFGGWYKEAGCTNKFDFTKPINESITLYAKWTEKTPPTPETVTITFDANGHGTPTNPITVNKGTVATAPTDPTDTENDFGGWYKEAGCTNKFDFTKPINESITLYAKWTEKTPPTPETVTITFDANGHGTPTNPITVNKGTVATAPTDPTDTENDFGGWYKEAGCTNKFDFTKPVNESITLYAKWTEKTPPTPETVTITFDANGHGTPTNPITVNKGEIATAPADPTDTENDFGGWYKEAGCTNKFDFTKPVNESITLYAKWTAKTPPAVETVTITFDANGHGTPTNPITVNKGEIATAPADPTDTENDFGGWYKEAGCTNKFDFTKPVNESITLYAKWTAKTPPAVETVTITFDANGHGTPTNPITVNKGTVATAPTDPTDTENDFGGWYKEAGCTNKFDFTKPINESITLYAKWTAKTPPTPETVTITFDANGHGTPTNPITVNKGTVATAPTDPTDTENDFGGWYKEAACTNKFDFPQAVNENITLYAKWTEKTPPTPVTVTITFDKNGGSGTMADVIKTKDESYTLPACGFTPPAGKEFKAWQVDGTEKNVGDKIVLNGDKNIKAVWKDIGSLPPTPPTPYTPYPWTVYPGWYYNFEPPKAKEEKPATKMEMDWKIELAIGISTIDRKINGTDSKIKMDVAPYIKDGRTMLPIRSVAEALGFEVEWNKSTRTVLLKDNTTRVEIPVDTNKIIVNGTVYTSDVKPEIKNNRTMLPIANIARALGLKDGKDIIWNSKSKTVTIYRSILVK